MESAPSTGHIHVVLPPADVGLRVSLHLAAELHHLVLQDHLVDGPPEEGWPLCRVPESDRQLSECVFFFFFFWGGGQEKQLVPNTVTWAVSLSLSPTMLVPTQMYMPASLFFVLEIISFPPRI